MKKKIKKETYGNFGLARVLIFEMRTQRRYINILITVRTWKIRPYIIFYLKIIDAQPIYNFQNK